MSGQDDASAGPLPAQVPSSTEETQAAPGWLEPSLDEILSDPELGLPQGPGLRAARNRYLDCLADPGRSQDLGQAHDRCRHALLASLGELEGISPDLSRRLEQRLETLEADLSDQL